MTCTDEGTRCWLHVLSMLLPSDIPTSNRLSVTSSLFIIFFISQAAVGPSLARLPIPPTATLPPYLCSFTNDLPISLRSSPTVFYCAMQNNSWVSQVGGGVLDVFFSGEL